MMPIKEALMSWTSLTFAIVLSLNIEASEVLPPSVLEFKEIQDRDSIEFEIASHKAIIDLKNLATSHLKTGNTASALKYLQLGIQLFPYRGDLIQLKARTLNFYIDKTNELIASTDRDCDYIAERVEFLKWLAPDKISDIKNLKTNCNQTLSADDLRNYSFNENNFDVLKTPKDIDHDIVLNNIEESIQINTSEIYPAMEQLILGIEFLGNISFVTHSIKYDENIKSWKDLKLEFQYYVAWGNYYGNFGKFCETLAAIFSAYASGLKSSSSCSPDRLGLSGIHSQEDYQGYMIKDLNSKDKYIGSNKAFNQLYLPQYLIFDEYEISKGEKKKIASHLFKLKSRDPTDWLLFSRLQEGRSNTYLGEYAHVPFPFEVKHPKFNFRENFIFEQNKASKEVLIKKMSYEFHFDRKETFKRYKSYFEQRDQKSNSMSRRTIIDFFHNIGN